MTDFQKFSEDRVEKAVNRIAPFSGIDPTGRDRDDYRSLLATKLWLSLQRVKGIPDEEKKGWVVATLRNQVISFQRELRVVPPMASDSEINNAYAKTNLENDIINRNLLANLRKALSQSDWSLLMAYLDNDCMTSPTWRALDEPGDFQGFQKTIKRLVGRCRKIIQRIG